MKEETVKTSVYQRVIIGLIAVFLLISTIGVYALIVLNGKASEGTTADNEAKLAEYETQLDQAYSDVITAIKNLSGQHFNTFNPYRSYVRGYNATTVDTAGLQITDIVTGDGEEFEAGTDYLVYYIGWCADESVFDSSFDDFDNPTVIEPIAYNTENMWIDGFAQGLVGMRIGGVREIDIPSELAYGDTTEICGGYNTPLKFLVYSVPSDSAYTESVNKYNQINTEYASLYYSVYGTQ